MFGGRILMLGGRVLMLAGRRVPVCPRFQRTKQAFIAAVTVIFKDFINHPSIRCVGILLRLPDRLTYQYIDSASSRIEPE